MDAAIVDRRSETVSQAAIYPCRCEVEPPICRGFLRVEAVAGIAALAGRSLGL